MKNCLTAYSRRISIYETYDLALICWKMVIGRSRIQDTSIGRNMSETYLSAWNLPSHRTKVGHVVFPIVTQIITSGVGTPMLISVVNRWRAPSSGFPETHPTVRIVRKNVGPVIKTTLYHSCIQLCRSLRQRILIFLRYIVKRSRSNDRPYIRQIYYKRRVVASCEQILGALQTCLLPK